MVVGLNLNSAIPMQKNYKAPEKKVGFGFFGFGKKAVKTAEQLVKEAAKDDGGTRAYRLAARAINEAGAEAVKNAPKTIAIG